MASATSFQIEHHSICSLNRSFGTAGVIPWDTEVFGFPVAEYRLGDAGAISADEAGFRDALAKWAHAARVKVMSCVVPAENVSALPVLGRIGFGFIELAVSATLPNLQKWTAPCSAPIRLTVLEDHAEIEAMAATAIQAGRYVADPSFDPAAAARRYIVWIKRALSGENADDRVFTLGEYGHPQCFFQVNVQNDSANLRLAGVRRDLQGGTLGYRLYAAVLDTLKKEGVRRAVGRLSATNTPVLNVFASLAFQFSNPEIVLHWHVQR